MCVQPGRDYEAFFKASAWGAVESRSPMDWTRPEIPPERPSRPGGRPDGAKRPTDGSRVRSSEKTEVSEASSGEARQQLQQQLQKMFPTPDPAQDTHSQC